MSTPSPVAVLIEDEPQIRRFVRAALEAEGWQVFEAATAQHGLRDAATRKPDLVVLDLGLPDGDGLDVIRDVRSWSAVPIVVLSARVEEDDKIAALDAGADVVDGGDLSAVSLPALFKRSNRPRQREPQPLVDRDTGALHQDLPAQFAPKGQGKRLMRQGRPRRDGQLGQPPHPRRRIKRNRPRPPQGNAWAGASGLPGCVGGYQHQVHAC